MLCGSAFIRRDEGPLARGYCGASCEHEAKHPTPIPLNQQEERRSG